MEIYLSHMVIFRVIERLGINTMIGNGWAQYAVTSVIVLVGAIIISAVIKQMLDLFGNIVSKTMAWMRVNYESFNDQQSPLTERR